MIRLKEVIDRQKILIRSLRQQLTQKHVDLDAVRISLFVIIFVF